MDSKILERIAKCLAVATHPNTDPNEAAAAKRQAEALMRKHGITGDMLEDAQITEDRYQNSGVKRPPTWKCSLAYACAIAVGCQLDFRAIGWESFLVFKGYNHAPPIANYLYCVLLYQAEQARDTYVKTLDGRFNKRARSAEFITGWVEAVGRKLRVMNLPVKVLEYKEQPGVKAIDLTKGFAAKQHGTAYLHGLREGQNAKLPATAVTETGGGRPNLIGRD